MGRTVRIGNRLVGEGQPCFVIAEIGINHNGHLQLAKRLIDAAKDCGADAVKFQKRTVEVVYTPEELARPRESPNHPIGYSGKEVGLQTSVAAAALGACVVERHITLDRALWGSDHAASIEPQGFQRLVRDIRAVEAALGDGVKRVYEGERPIMSKLRRPR